MWFLRHKNTLLPFKNRVRNSVCENIAFLLWYKSINKVYRRNYKIFNVSIKLFPSCPMYIRHATCPGHPTLFFIFSLKNNNKIGKVVQRKHFAVKHHNNAFFVPCCWVTYRGAEKSLARPTSRCILFDGENISFDTSLVLYIYINSTNIPPIMIINKIYENQNLLSL